jgi:hypothetical protein
MATNPDDFALRTKGIESTSDLTLGMGDQPLPQFENKTKLDKFRR